MAFKHNNRSLHRKNRQFKSRNEKLVVRCRTCRRRKIKTIKYQRKK